MNNQEYAKIVIDELTHTLTKIDQEAANQFVEMIDEADEVFCAGAGRSGFQVKGFCDAFNAYGEGKLCSRRNMYPKY